MLKVTLRKLFGCAHAKTTFPLTRKATPGRVSTIAGAYVVCLDCGEEFGYDWAQMRVGEPVRRREPIATEQQVHTFVG